MEKSGCAAVALALVALIVMSGASLPADEGGARNGPGDKPEVWVSAPGADPTGNAGGSGSVVCRLYEITVFTWRRVGYGSAPGNEANPRSKVECPTGSCVPTATSTCSSTTPRTSSIRAPLAAALRELPPIYSARELRLHTVKQLVGVRTWLWVDPADWQPMSATATIVGLSATVTAQPTKVIWTMGDGSMVICNGPGTPYKPTVPDREQSSSCSYTYQHDGTYTVRATIVWTVSWTATNGQGGTLPNVQRSTEFLTLSPSSSVKPPSPGDDLRSPTVRLEVTETGHAKA